VIVNRSGENPQGMKYVTHKLIWSGKYLLIGGSAENTFLEIISLKNSRIFGGSFMNSNLYLNSAADEYMFISVMKVSNLDAIVS
jgi:hypothetical protein